MTSRSRPGTTDRLTLGIIRYNRTVGPKFLQRAVLSAMIVMASFVLSACRTPWSQEFAGLTVQSADGSNFQVYLNDLHLGQAPIQRSDIKPGTYRIKLDPGDGTKMYEGQIRLHSGTISTVLWSFAGQQPTGTGEILELEPLASNARAELSVITVPEGSTVQLNNTTYGLSPVILDEAEPGQYSLTLNAVGHLKKTMAVRIEAGHRLHVFSRLERSGESLDQASPLPVPMDGTTPAPSTESGSTPTPSPTATPTTTPTASGSGTVMTPPYLTIKETGTGWLRVRSSASSAGTEVARVNVGTRHSVKQMQDGWYQIEYEPGKTGWVSGQYVDYVAGP